MTNNLYHHIPIMLSKGLKIALIGLLLASCGTTKRIVDAERVVTTYRDSTIYNVKDSIVWTPKEYYRDYASMLDTLTISGDFSEFRAWNDTSLHIVTGTARIEPKIEEKWHIQYVDKIVERTDTLTKTETIEIPVEVIKYKRDKLFWWLLSYAGVTISIIIIYILRKFNII